MVLQKKPTTPHAMSPATKYGWKSLRKQNQVINEGMRKKVSTAGIKETLGFLPKNEA